MTWRGGSSIIICGQRYDVGQRVITFEDNTEINAYTPHRTDKPSEIPPFAPAKGMAGDARSLAPAPPHRRRSLDRAPAPGGPPVRRAPRRLLRIRAPASRSCTTSAACRCTSSSTTTAPSSRRSTSSIAPSRPRASTRSPSVSSSPTAATRMRFPNDYHGKRDKVTCTHQRPSVPRLRVHAGADGVDDLDRQGAGAPLPQPAAGLSRRAAAASRCGPRSRDAREYTGYLGHYHVTKQKWDPGPFDFKFFASQNPRAHGLPGRHRRREKPRRPRRSRQAPRTWRSRSSTITKPRAKAAIPRRSLRRSRACGTAACTCAPTRARRCSRPSPARSSPRA